MTEKNMTIRAVQWTGDNIANIRDIFYSAYMDGKILYVRDKKASVGDWVVTLATKMGDFEYHAYVFSNENIHTELKNLIAKLNFGN